MKKISAFQIPFRAFYPKDLYRFVCFDRKGTGFGYLFILLAVCWIPSVVKIHIGLARLIENDAPKIINQVPQITFNNGVASLDVPQPYTITDPKTKKILVVIDTTGKVKNLKETPARLLVTKTEAIFKKNDIETQTFNYTNFHQFVLNQNKINCWLEVIRKRLALIYYPFAVVGSYIYRILQILLYAAIGILFASWCRSKRSYDSLLRLATVAVTPCIIISTILEVSGIKLPFAGLWYFLLAMTYLFIGVRQCAKVAAQPAADSDSGPAPDDRHEPKPLI